MFSKDAGDSSCPAARCLLLSLIGLAQSGPENLRSPAPVSAGAIVVVVIAVLILAHARENRSGFQRCSFYRLILPTSISFVWFELLNNHTQLHPHFVYRSASGAIAILLTAMVIANRTPISPE
jgi:hypothetical protein